MSLPVVEVHIAKLGNVQITQVVLVKLVPGDVACPIRCWHSTTYRRHYVIHPVHCGLVIGPTCIMHPNHAGTAVYSYTKSTVIFHANLPCLRLIYHFMQDTWHVKCSIIITLPPRGLQTIAISIYSMSVCLPTHISQHYMFKFHKIFCTRYLLP